MQYYSSTEYLHTAPKQRTLSQMVFTGLDTSFHFMKYICSHRNSAAFQLLAAKPEHSLQGCHHHGISKYPQGKASVLPAYGAVPARLTAPPARVTRAGRCHSRISPADVHQAFTANPRCSEQLHQFQTVAQHRVWSTFQAGDSRGS